MSAAVPSPSWSSPATASASSRPPSSAAVSASTSTSPAPAHLASIVRAHLGEPDAHAQDLIDRFLSRGTDGELATDQLLNAIYLTGTAGIDAVSRDDLAEQLMPYLSRTGDESDAF